MNFAAMLQQYEGGTASFKQCGAENPAVTQAALAIISGEARIQERNADIERPNVADARSQSTDKGRS